MKYLLLLAFLVLMPPYVLAADDPCVNVCSNVCVKQSLATIARFDCTRKLTDGCYATVGECAPAKNGKCVWKKSAKLDDCLKKKNENTLASCVTAGCSGQLCVERGAENALTTCEYTKAYDCYKKVGICERAPLPYGNGRCGWRQTNELKQCIDDASRPVAPSGGILLNPRRGG